MELTKTTTERGFQLIEFTDRTGEICSIQVSSLATENAVWFGTDHNRMHLTTDHLKELLPVLQKFVETGELF